MRNNTGSRPPLPLPPFLAMRPSRTKAGVKSRVREKNSISRAAAAYDFQTFFVDEESASGENDHRSGAAPPTPHEGREEDPFLPPPLPVRPPLDINIHLHPLRPLQLPPPRQADPSADPPPDGLPKQCTAPTTTDPSKERNRGREGARG